MTKKENIEIICIYIRIFPRHYLSEEPDGDYGTSIPFRGGSYLFAALNLGETETQTDCGQWIWGSIQLAMISSGHMFTSTAIIKWTTTDAQRILINPILREPWFLHGSCQTNCSYLINSLVTRSTSALANICEICVWQYLSNIRQTRWLFSLSDVKRCVRVRSEKN